jgi:ankyrin repeat protein
MDKGTKRGRSGSGSRKSRSSGSRSSSNKTKKNKPLTLNEKLINACFHNQHEVAIQLLLQEANANYIDQTTGYTPLLIACERNNIKLVRFLIKRGADVNFRGFKNSPFPLDLSEGSIKELLLKKGAIGTVEQPNQLDEDMDESDLKYILLTDEGFAHLSIRIRNKKNHNDENGDAIKTLKKIVKMKKDNPNLELYDQRINLDTLNKFGNTLLEEACSRNKLEIVRLLIQAGANVNINNKSDYFTPLGTAIVEAGRNGDAITIIAELVKAGADVNMKYGENNNIPLITACYDGNFDVVEILLSSPNINPNVIDDDGDTPLIAAIESTIKPKNRVSCDIAIQIIEMLIRRGADVNFKNSKGELPTDVARKNESCTELEEVLASYSAQFSMAPPRSRS